MSIEAQIITTGIISDDLKRPDNLSGYYNSRIKDGRQIDVYRAYKMNDLIDEIGIDEILSNRDYILNIINKLDYNNFCEFIERVNICSDADLSVLRDHLVASAIVGKTYQQSEFITNSLFLTKDPIVIANIILEITKNEMELEYPNYFGNINPEDNFGVYASKSLSNIGFGLIILSNLQSISDYKKRAEWSKKIIEKNILPWLNVLPQESTTTINLENVALIINEMNNALSDCDNIDIDKINGLFNNMVNIFNDSGFETELPYIDVVNFDTESGKQY